MRELDRITARRGELDTLAEELAKRLRVVRAERDRAEAAAAVRPAPAQVAGRVVLLIPHRSETGDEAALPADYRKILAILRTGKLQGNTIMVITSEVITTRERERNAAMSEHSHLETSTPGSSWALVTGSTSGIGRATAAGLAQDGYSVIVTGRDRERAAETRRSIEAAGGRAIDLVADLGDPAAVRGLVEQIRDAIDGPLDVLVHNAGGGGFAPTESTPEEMFDAAFNVHAKAPFILTGAFAPAMAERGRGAIVNVGSLSTSMAAAGTCAFQASKAALSMMTRSWTAEYGPRGVRVNSVDPGFILTPVNEGIRDMYGTYLASLPAGRGGDPEDVANAVRFLVSPRASYVNGTTLTVDGGKTAVVAM